MSIPPVGQAVALQTKNVTVPVAGKPGYPTIMAVSFTASPIMVPFALDTCVVVNVTIGSILLVTVICPAPFEYTIMLVGEYPTIVNPVSGSSITLIVPGLTQN